MSSICCGLTLDEHFPINLWKDVKIAKNLSPGDIPRNMTLGGAAVAHNAVADTFAGHFHSKILSNVNKTRVDMVFMKL